MSPRGRALLGCLVVASLIVGQWVLFQRFAEREIVWAYPANHDQTAYLGRSYETFESIRTNGLFRGLADGMRRDAPNGVMIHLQASLLFLLLGPSRLSALTLNFIYFALFQVVLVWLLHWLTRRWSVALLGLGLLLCSITPFFWAGGVMDFRIDFIAFCLFGIFIAAVLRSGVLASTRWSLVAGGVAALLVLFRFITSVYLAGIFVAFVGWLIVRWWRQRRDPGARSETARRIRGSFACGAAAAVVTLPALWLNRKALYDYYVVGHLTGSEKNIRAAEAGVFTSFDSVIYYAKSLALSHAGWSFLALGALAIVATLPFAWRRRPAGLEHVRPEVDAPLAFGFLAACLVVPYLILTANVAKSPVVGDILVPPLLFLVLLAAVQLSGARRGAIGAPAHALSALAVAALLLGAYTQVVWLTGPGLFSESRRDVEEILRLYDTIFEHSERSGWRAPVVSIDRIADYLAAPTMDVSLYERHGKLFDARNALGATIFEISLPDALEQLGRSDFVVISLPRQFDEVGYPFDFSMFQMRPTLLNACYADHTLLRMFQIRGRPVLLFARKKRAS